MLQICEIDLFTYPTLTKSPAEIALPGGVLVAFHDDITAQSLDNLTSNCKIVWTKVHFARNKSIILFASYSPAAKDHFFVGLCIL